MKTNKKTSLKKILLFIFGIVIFAIISVFLALLVKDTQNYPQGNDIYGHLFKTNLLHKAIKDGTLFPTYTNLWYNGVDLFRYWPPASYYVLAFLMFFTNSDIILAFPIFVGLMFFIGAFGWLLFGYKENRMCLSIFIGIVFFFLPDNMRVFFSEGNIPRIFITTLLPYLYFFIMQFVKYKKKFAIIPITIITSLIVFTHIMISAMVGLSTFVVLLIYSIINKEYKSSIIAICTMLSSYLLMGIILIPSLIGGIVSQDSSASIATSATWSQDVLKTLNPLLHINDLGLFYFGISLFIIIVVGLIITRKDVTPFFATSLIILLSTSTTMVHLISMLPLSQVFWMQRFIPIACVFFVIGLLYWKQCRKIITILFVVLICIDCIPTLAFLNSNIDTPYNKNTIVKQNNYIETYMLNQAEEITQNRIAFLDLSNSGSFPSYYFSRNIMNGESKSYIYGWAYQGAYTEKEIVSINESFEYGYFNYTFDRLVEMGADTIIVKKDEIGNKIINKTKNDIYNEFLQSANFYNYELVNENSYAYLLKLKLSDIQGNFGCITKYENIAIGSSSYYISYLYPTFKNGDSVYLDDYSFDELAQYSKIYLSGFKYKNKEQVENLLIDLSNNNVDIFIDMNNIPINELSQKKEFLDVYAQFVTFTDKFPIIETNNGSQFKLNMETSNYENWYCVYLTGVEKNERISTYNNGTNLAYYGTTQNEHIHFIGFNLLYYCVSDKNDDLINYFNEIFQLTKNEKPNRTLVPINVNYDYNKIVINTLHNDVNINLSNLEGFMPNRFIKEEHHLIKVPKGETIILVEYPRIKEGFITTIIGFISLTIVYLYTYITIFKNEEKNEKKNN